VHKRALWAFSEEMLALRVGADDRVHPVQTNRIADIVALHKILSFVTK
jgi:hypothetical protein